MSRFTAAQREYLGGRRLARLATVGPDGVPHVVPVGTWRLDAERGILDVGGHGLRATKKFRDVAATGRAAVVVDDLASTDPWRPRGIEIRGRAEAVDGGRPVIRVHGDRVVAWGLEAPPYT